MELDYKVQAQVVNINSDIPKKEDKFLLDTNILLWAFYPSTHSDSLPKNLRPKRYQKRYQITKYPKYLKKIQYARSSLFYCGLSMAEMAHIIEKYEKENFFSELNLKEYRHNYPDQRKIVVNQIQTCWLQVEAIADSAEILINKITTKDAINNFKNVILDGYDSFIIESMFKAGINQVITDDGDYITVPGIKVFTANKSAIDAAKSQGKLLNR